VSLNISKSFLEVENIKLSNQGKELNYKQIENLYYKLNYLDKNNDNYADSFKDMINKLENSYINKSSKMLEKSKITLIIRVEYLSITMTLIIQLKIIILMI
jgi:hypothetical protein